MQYIILIFDHFWFACMSANHFLITYNNTSLSEPMYIRHRPKQIKTLNSCICHTAHSEKTQTDIPGRVKTLGICIRWFFIEMLCKRTELDPEYCHLNSENGSMVHFLQLKLLIEIKSGVVIWIINLQLHS